MSTIRSLRKKMTSTRKPNMPVPPPYKFDQLPKDHRRILSYLFDKYIEGSHIHTDLGLAKHEAHKILVAMFDRGELRIVSDREISNSHIDPEARWSLESWNATADTFTLV